jgi:sugar lactone lactonase YvrE
MLILLLLALGFVGPGALSTAGAARAAPGAAAPQTPKSNAALAKEARDAYDRGEKAVFLSIYEELARRRPGDVFTLYNLACGQSLNGRSEAAVRTLEDILAHRVASNLDADTDFDSIRTTEGYRRVVTRMAALRKEQVTSGAARAFTIPEKGFVAEGVAYDPVTKAFFVSSVRRRKIVRIDPRGRITDFVAAGRDGLRSALGMRVDPKRRTLWVASEAIPSMDGYRKGQPRAAAVFEYDVDSGRLRKEHLPSPGEGDAPGFDDLALAPDGSLFVNDGFNPRIWRLAPGGELQVFLASDAFGGTQGMAVSEDGKTLYFSDYRGLFAVNVATRKVTPLGVPPDLALNGIDGLALSGGSLIAIQNGILPHRVIRLDLAPDGLTISRARILEMNHPDFDEPTLGVVEGGALYFSADSQGQKFLDEKHPISPDDMREAFILKLPL